jgi:hypothetical protein
MCNKLYDEENGSNCHREVQELACKLMLSIEGNQEGPKDYELSEHVVRRVQMQKPDKRVYLSCG